MRVKLLLLCVFVATALTTTVSAKQPFDYERTQWLYVVTESEFITYAHFPGFLEFRDLIVSKMQTADEYFDERSAPIYTMRLIGIREATTLYVGDSWIGDGERAAELNEDEFKWIKDSVQNRKGEGGDLARLESSIRWVVDSQKDPAWEPDL